MKFVAPNSTTATTNNWKKYENPIVVIGLRRDNISLRVDIHDGKSFPSSIIGDDNSITAVEIIFLGIVDKHNKMILDKWKEKEMKRGCAMM